MIKCIFFDFDGTLIESAEIKTDAFRELFEDYPDNVDEIVQYHKENGGMSRYEKFDYIYSNILREELSRERKKELGKRFSELVLGKVLKCAFVEGTTEFLEKYYKKIELYLISATPDEELKYTVKERGLEKYFKGIFGAPMKKSGTVNKIAGEKGISKKEILLIGDSKNDLKAAEDSGVRFIGRALPNGENKFPEGIEIINNLDELEKVVGEYEK